VLALVFGGVLLANFPDAALGALIVYAATRLIDIDEFLRIARFVAASSHSLSRRWPVCWR
jgi:SulP family sulfate permease